MLYNCGSWARTVKDLQFGNSSNKTNHEIWRKIIHRVCSCNGSCSGSTLMLGSKWRVQDWCSYSYSWWGICVKTQVNGSFIQPGLLSHHQLLLATCLAFFPTTHRFQWLQIRNSCPGNSPCNVQGRISPHALQKKSNSSIHKASSRILLTSETPKKTGLESPNWTKATDYFFFLGGGAATFRKLSVVFKWHLEYPRLQ